MSHGHFQSKMNNTELIPIFIPNEEAEKFLLFQKHYELFVLMEKSGALGIKYGKCVINFKDGVIENITKEEVVYKRT